MHKNLSHSTPCELAAVRVHSFFGKDKALLFYFGQLRYRKGEWEQKTHLRPLQNTPHLIRGQTWPAPWVILQKEAGKQSAHRHQNRPGGTGLDLYRSFALLHESKKCQFHRPGKSPHFRARGLPSPERTHPRFQAPQNPLPTVYFRPQATRSLQDQCVQHGGSSPSAGMAPTTGRAPFPHRAGHQIPIRLTAYNSVN